MSPVSRNDKETILDKMFGDFFRKKRILLGLSQSEIARKVNITFQSVQKYEKGLHRISLYRVFQLCNALKVNPIDFLISFLEEFKLSEERFKIGIYPETQKSDANKFELRLMQNFQKLNDKEKEMMIAHLKNFANIKQLNIESDEFENYE